MRLLGREKFKFALLSGLGLLHACNYRASDGDNSGRQPVTPAARDAAATVSPAHGDADASGSARADAGTLASSAVPNHSGGLATSHASAETEAGVPPTSSVAVSSEAGVLPSSSSTTVTSPEAGTDASVSSPVCGGEQLQASGLAYCVGGAVHRVHGGTCESDLPRPGNQVEEPPVVGAPSDAGADAGPRYDYRCLSDLDCDAHPHGHCEAFSITDAFSLGGQAPVYGSSCKYGCQVDADCGEGSVCECGDVIGQCVPATCAADAECPSGEACFRYSFHDGCFQQLGYQCSSAQDECLTDDDCGEDQACMVDVVPGARTCSGALCAIGRPFLVDQQTRHAQLERTSDWQACPVETRVEAHLDAEACQAANEWRRIGLMEHASVAAFARFALQLLGVGAPAELVRAATQAMADETRHAELAFGLARQFDGEAVGPGPLNMDGVLAETALERIVVNTVLEGCVGETVAALEAAIARQATPHPAIANVLGSIERDESNHALLAWRFLQWALLRDATMAHSVRRLLEQEHALALRAQGPENERDLSRFGIVSERTRQQLRRDVLQNVVLPTFDALAATLPAPNRSESRASMLAC